VEALAMFDASTPMRCDRIWSAAPCTPNNVSAATMASLTPGLAFGMV